MVQGDTEEDLIEGNHLGMPEAYFFEGRPRPCAFDGFLEDTSEEDSLQGIQSKEIPGVRAAPRAVAGAIPYPKAILSLPAPEDRRH